MTGTAPTVTLALDSADPYVPGVQLVATATVHDPDSYTEALNGTDGLGVPFAETIVHSDTDLISWSWQSTGDLIMSNVNPMSVAAPAVSDVLVATVTDAEGNVTTATIAVPVRQPMRVGATFLATDAATHAKLFPGNAYYRVYTPPAKGLYGWATAAVKAVPASALMHESFKDTPSTALLQPWFDAVPPGVLEVWLTVHHEPEGDLPTATYDADWSFVRQFRDQHPNGHKVKLVQDLTEYAELHGKGPWQSWITADCDIISVDCYRNAIAGDSYPDPAVFFALPIAISKATGKPWAVPEFGGDRTTSDTDGSGRAKWMTECVAYARANGCVAISWFCAQGTTSHAATGYHLDTLPNELKAWQKAIAAR